MRGHRALREVRRPDLADAGVTIPTSNITWHRRALHAHRWSPGDAVAAIVYVSDATTAADRVDTVAIPGHDVTADCPDPRRWSDLQPGAGPGVRAYVLSEQGTVGPGGRQFLA